MASGTPGALGVACWLFRQAQNTDFFTTKSIKRGAQALSSLKQGNSLRMMLRIGPLPKSCNFRYFIHAPSGLLFLPRVALIVARLCRFAAGRPAAGGRRGHAGTAGNHRPARDRARL